jgi:hypothetical protein
MKRLFKWEAGRQKDVVYYKMKLFSFKVFNFGFDGYILKYPPNTELPLHKDPVKNGEHYRINITLTGKALFLLCTQDDCSIKTISDKCVNYFRPDLCAHSLIVGGKECKKLSLGFVKFN